MNLKKNRANFAALSPIDFLKRTAKIFPNYTSLISENKKFTWGQTFKRCNLLASSLIKTKIKLESKNVTTREAEQIIFKFNTSFSIYCSFFPQK